MAIDWPDVEQKARAMKEVSARVVALTHAVNTGTIAGRPLHADTLRDLKAVDGPAVRTEVNDAWDALNAAMTQ